jgi:glycosyltransferase involved in cell wall biosynthesis
LAALEACACGVPVVTTHQAPIPGLDEADAGITTQYSLADVAAALDRTLGLTDGAREIMGARAERLIRERFSLDGVADQLEQVYRRAALGADGRP